MRIAFVGCGFVADYYARTLKFHPDLQLAGVFDQDATRTQRFAKHYSTPSFPTLDALLQDDRIEILVNLTNPASHFDISKAGLQAGKHVYSEKPLATRMDDARELVSLAESKALHLSGAPCSLLGECAQAVWKALRDNRVGTPRLVYAEMDDGMLHLMPYRRWSSASGTPWPHENEFQTGCTLEHAGYYLSWLPAFFGPAVDVTAVSHCLITDKQSDAPLAASGPDFSVACIRFESGVVARLTCSIVAPHDHQLRIIGDDGILLTDDCWDYLSPVYLRRRIRVRRSVRLSPLRKRYRLAQSSGIKPVRSGSQRMDFCRGIAEMARAIREHRVCRLSASYCLHVNELVLAIHNSTRHGSSTRLQTTFTPVEPMPWAT